MAVDSKQWLRTRIYITRALLLDITPRTPSQEIAHGRCIGRLGVLELGGGTDPLDTGAVCRDDIDAMKFNDFKAFVLNIEHGTSTAYKQATRTQEARERLTLTQNIQTWMSSDHKLDCIEALLQRTELEREQHSQLEYAKRTGRMLPNSWTSEQDTGTTSKPVSSTPSWTP